MPYPSKTDRQTILDTAMSQVQSAGISRLAIRSVAAALGLTPNALYRYFTSLAALQIALTEESLCRLLAVLRKAAGKKPPSEALRAIARAYVRFAREQPHVFALTMMPLGAEADSDAAHLRLWQFVLEHVSRIYGEQRAPEAAIVIWAFLHGVTALEAARVFGVRKPVSSFEFGLQMWLAAAGESTKPRGEDAN